VDDDGLTSVLELATGLVVVGTDVVDDEKDVVDKCGASEFVRMTCGEAFVTYKYRSVEQKGGVPDQSSILVFLIFEFPDSVKDLFDNS
jgi:hypothetical protein